MSDNLREHDPLRELMKESMLHVPFSDFEARVMQQVNKEAEIRALSSRDRKIAYVLFIVGMASGIVLTSVLPTLTVAVYGVPEDVIRLGCQIVSATLIIVLMNSVIQKIKFRRSFR